MSNNHKKRSFVYLMVLVLVMLVFLAFVIWLGVVSNSMAIKVVIWATLTLVFSLSLIFGLGIFLLVQKIHSGKKIGVFGPIIKSSIRLLYPFVMAVCGVLKIDKEKIQGSFIEINNELLLNSATNKLSPADLLILMPHCIQNSFCKHKITSDIRNCTGCGKCDVKGVIDVASKYKVKLAIATGGTLARRIIKENRPKGVLAVACERDLSSGILDCDPLPVIGVLNLRPNGPCFNTGVDMIELEEGLKNLIEEAK